MNRLIFSAKTLPFGYLALVLMALSYLLCNLPDLKTDSSVLSLLPSFDRRDQRTEQAFLKRLDRQIVFLVSAQDPAHGEEAVRELQHALAANPLIATTYTGPSAEDMAIFSRFYLEYTTALVDEDTRIKLTSGQQEGFVLSQIYLPLGGALGPELACDPLLLIRARQLYELSHTKTRFKREGSLTYLEDQGQRYYLLYVTTASEGFATEQASALGAFLDAQISDLQTRYSDLQVLKHGTVFYNRYFAEQARHDLTFLGSCTIGGVILLLYLCFRSLIPLFLTLLSIGTALTFGLSAVLIVFGKVHLITLVMGLSIIGICTDYSIYYLTRRLLHGRKESPQQSLLNLKIPLTHALITTSCAYLLLLLPPFPGLRQLAVFCIFGLLGAFGTVILWQPLLSSRLTSLHCQLTVYGSLLHRWQRLAVPLTVTLTILASGGLLRAHCDDDPQALQSAPAAIQAEDARVAQLLGQDHSQTFLLLKSRSSGELAAGLEHLHHQLEKAVAQHYLTGYTLPRYNSPATQQADFALIRAQLPEILKRLTPLKLAPTDFNYHYEPLSFEAFLAGPEGLLFRSLYLPTEKEVALLVPLQGLADAKGLGQLILPTEQLTVSVIDRRSDFTEVFKKYRYALSYLLVAALLGLFCLNLCRLRELKGALRLTLPNLLSILCALGVNGWAGYPLTLFTLLALFLVLGIGIDYVLLFRHAALASEETMFAITLCLATTILTLGILTFSSTQVIASFGLTLSTGILVTYLLSPWSRQQEKQPD